MHQLEIITDFNETLARPWYQLFAPYTMFIDALNNAYSDVNSLQKNIHVVSNTFDLFYRGGLRQKLEASGLHLGPGSFVINQSNYESVIGTKRPSHVIERKIMAIDHIRREVFKNVSNPQQQLRSLALVGDNSSFDLEIYLSYLQKFKSFFYEQKIEVKIFIHRYNSKKNMRQFPNVIFFDQYDGPLTAQLIQSQFRDS